MSHFKKCLIVLLCFAFTMSTNYFNKVSAAEKADKNKVEAKNKADQAKKEEKTSEEKIIKITKSPNWLVISKFWKQLNALDINKLNESKLITFNDLSIEKEKVSGSLKDLRNEGLITQEEKDALQYFIGLRFGYLQLKAGIILFDNEDQIDAQVVKKLDNLEGKYDTLENLFKEKKPNHETVKKNREDIVKSIEFIEDPKGENKFKPSNDVIDLIVDLNK